MTNTKRKGKQEKTFESNIKPTPTHTPTQSYNIYKQKRMNEKIDQSIDTNI